MNYRQLLLWPALVVAAALFGPTTLQAQVPAELVCKDGSTAPGPSRSACEGHGGVDEAATQAAVKARSGAGLDSAQRVVCIDGSNAPAGPSACRNQGGVDSVATRAAIKARGQGEAATGMDTTGMDTTMNRDTTRTKPPY